jgi:hypothetical protein
MAVRARVLNIKYRLLHAATRLKQIYQSRNGDHEIYKGDKKSETEEMHVPATLNQEPIQGHIQEGMMIELRGGANIHFTTICK